MKLLDEIFNLLPSNRHLPRDAIPVDDLEEIDRLRKQAKDEYEEWYEEESRIRCPNQVGHYSYYDNMKKQIWKPYNEEIDKILNKKSEYHRKMFEDLLDKFSKRYDLNDVRVHLLVKEFLVNLLMKMRVDRNLLQSSMLETIYTETGEMKVITPYLNARNQFTQMYVKLIETLDRITKEDKIIETETSKSKLFSKYISQIDDSEVIEIESEEKK